MTRRLHGRAGGLRGPGRPRAAARQLRRLGGGRARPVVGPAPALLAAGPRSTTCARCSASGCPRCPPTRACTRCRSSTASTCSATTRTAAAGLYAVAIKLATVVFVAVRGFQYAWPPLAYSIESDEEAAGLYSLVTTYYALATGVVVCAVALLGRWIVRLLAAPRITSAPTARCRGWRSAGRCTGCTSCSSRSAAAPASPRATSPPRPAAWRSTSRCCWCWSRRAGADLGIAGAGLALCGAYVAMLVVMYAADPQPLQRRLRMAPARAADRDCSAASRSRGELLLPTSGLGGLAARVAWLGLVPGVAAADALLRTARARRRTRAARRRPPAGGRLPRRPRRPRGLRRGPAARRVRPPASRARAHLEPVSRPLAPARSGSGADGRIPPADRRVGLGCGSAPGGAPLVGATVGVGGVRRAAHGAHLAKRAAPVAAALAERWPELTRSNGGGSNVLLIRGQGLCAYRQVILRRRPERRVAQLARLRDGTCVANLPPAGVVRVGGLAQPAPRPRLRAGARRRAASSAARVAGQHRAPPARAPRSSSAVSQRTAPARRARSGACACTGRGCATVRRSARAAHGVVGELLVVHRAARRARTG